MSTKPVVPAPFRKDVSALRQDYRDLQGAAQQWVEMFVSFCRKFNDSWARAHDIDRSHGNSDARDLLLEEFKDVDESVRSKWRKIGSESGRLLKASVVRALPPTRDAIYEVAKLPQAKLATLVTKGVITNESSVRDIRTTGTRKRRAPKPKTYLATVTLGFEDYEKAAAALADVLTGDGEFVVRAHHAFVSAVKANLGAVQYAAVDHRFSSPKRGSQQQTKRP
jgi:hypothetical protein